MVREGEVEDLVSHECPALLVRESSEPRGRGGRADAGGPGGLDGRIVDTYQAQGEGREKGMLEDQSRDRALEQVDLGHRNLLSSRSPSGRRPPGAPAWEGSADSGVGGETVMDCLEQRRRIDRGALADRRVAP